MYVVGVRLADGSALIAVRVRPGASRTAVGGRYEGVNGPALVVAVSAPPVDGRATEAVLAAIAEAVGVRRRQVELVSGSTARDKRIAVSDPPVDLDDRIAALMDR